MYVEAPFVVTFTINPIVINAIAIALIVLFGSIVGLKIYRRWRSSPLPPSTPSPSIDDMDKLSNSELFNLIETDDHAQKLLFGDTIKTKLTNL
jgi:hypothetical protein